MRKALIFVGLMATSSVVMAAEVVLHPFPKVTLAPGEVTDQTASCKQGQVLLSGGYEMTGVKAALSVVSCHPINAGGTFNSWRVAVINTRDTPAYIELTIYTVCQ